ncbi:MAG: hypothetical protein IPL79_20370 [Myxococcales bacterium]|nr:hypothetical protein [Myxococcales bacterium]
MNPRTVIAIAAAAIVSACASTIATPRAISKSEAATAKATIKSHLRAPDSAQFGDMRAYSLANGETAYCVSLNAQNGFGGMTGFQPALVNMKPGRAPLVWLDDLAAYECGNLSAGRSARV